MEVAIDWLIGLMSAAFFGFMGLFGWSHKNLDKKIRELEDDVMKKTDIKEFIELELRPLEIEYRVLEKKTDHIAEQQTTFDIKLDRMQDKLNEIAVKIHV